MERDLQVQLRPEDEEVDNHQELLVLQGDGGVARVHHFLDHLKGRGGFTGGTRKKLTESTKLLAFFGWSNSNLY